MSVNRNVTVPVGNTPDPPPSRSYQSTTATRPPLTSKRSPRNHGNAGRARHQVTAKRRYPACGRFTTMSQHAHQMDRTDFELGTLRAPPTGARRSPLSWVWMSDASSGWWDDEVDGW